MTRAMVRSALAIALVAAMLGFVQTARAEGEKSAGRKEITGKITAVDKTANTFTLKHKTDSMTFSATDDTKYGSGGRNLNLNVTNLSVGDKVTVHYSDQGGKLVARKISRVDVTDAKANRDEKKAAH